MRRPFSYFSHYFTDNSAVKYLIIKYFFINIGTLFPKNSQNVAKFSIFKI
jgi:hypothetical protein